MTKSYLEHVLIIPRDRDCIDVEIQTCRDGRHSSHMSLRVGLEGLYDTVFEILEKLQPGPNSWVRSPSDPASVATAEHAWAAKRARICID